MLGVGERRGEWGSDIEGGFNVGGVGEDLERDGGRLGGFKKITLWRIEERVGFRERDNVGLDKLCVRYE